MPAPFRALSKGFSRGSCCPGCGVEQRSLAKSRQEGRNGIVRGGQLQGRASGQEGGSDGEALD